MLEKCYRRKVACPLEQTVTLARALTDCILPENIHTLPWGIFWFDPLSPPTTLDSIPVKSLAFETTSPMEFPITLLRSPSTVLLGVGMDISLNHTLLNNNSKHKNKNHLTY